MIAFNRFDPLKKITGTKYKSLHSYTTFTTLLIQESFAVSSVSQSSPSCAVCPCKTRRFCRRAHRGQQWLRLAQQTRWCTAEHCWQIIELACHG